MSKSLSYRGVGDAFHFINLANIAAYGSCIYMFGGSKDGLFDSKWLTEGFCLHDTETPFWTTHDVSCYVMLAMSVLGLAVWYLGHNKPGMDRANQLTFWALIGAIGHGLGHQLIANGKRMGYYPENGDAAFVEDLRGDPWWLILAKVGPGFPLFWIPLVKTYMMNTTKNRMVGTAFVFQTASMFTPVKFGFSFTQSVLFAGLSLDQLFLPDNEKGFEYALWPILTVVPSGIFTWIESTGCTTSPLMKDHGHVIYDVYMTTSYTLFYVLCWMRSTRLSIRKVKGE
jgi:hypothetical protein